LKVILSVDALTPVLTGIGRYTWELAQRLPLVGEIEGIRFFCNRKWIKNPHDLLLPAGHLAHEQNRKKTGLRIRMPRWITDATLKRSCRNQLFHGPNYFLPPCAERGVITVHDLSVFMFPETHPVERIKQFEREFLRSVSQASHLITDSEVMRQEVMSFLSWPSEKITAVPLGVSSVFAPHPKKLVEPFLKERGLIHDGYILCVSTLEPRKKIDHLLQAYRALPMQLRDRFPLVLAGSRGWLSETLHREIDRYASEGWVRNLGFVSEDDLPLLFAGARLFVYPSGYEGFGLPVLEAMASGVPVVVSNCSSLPEVTQGAALLVDPDDIDALGSAIEAGLSDATWRATAMETGLAVAQRYTWERCIKETLCVYQRVYRHA
jgi:glycosyltransferase involved in cell wall biosynthesis